MAFTKALATTLAVVLLASGVFGIDQSPLFLDGKKLPDDFVYGCATSAYQVEGGWNLGGKSESIWDKFAHDKGKGHIANDDTGDVATDFYHRYKTDLPLFKKAIGVNYYDFTMAWTRIVPGGHSGSKVNKEGVEFYRNVIKAANDAGLKTVCTLYHWDVPQVLEDSYHSWKSKKIVNDFRYYAEKTFENFHDVCTDWITMNEPRTFCTEGFGPEPDSAPGKKGPIDDTYTCMHHALLSHANAVDAFRKGGYKGRIGIKVDGSPSKPLDPDSKADRDAVKRANDFEIGWDTAPLYTGDYPPIMREVMGDRLKSFTKAEKKLLKGSADWLGFDGYTSQWVTPIKNCGKSHEAWPECVESFQKHPKTKKLIGRPTESSWNFQVNDTVLAGLTYLHSWGATNLFLGENGMAVKSGEYFPLSQQLMDVERVEWFRNTLVNLKLALDNKLPLIGFVPWSCIANLEWSGGYAIDFGVIHNNQKTQKRTPKASAAYLKSVMTGGKPIDPYGFF